VKATRATEIVFTEPIAPAGKLANSLCQVKTIAGGGPAGNSIS
jgi:hypothetical protein